MGCRWVAAAPVYAGRPAARALATAGNHGLRRPSGDRIAAATGRGAMPPKTGHAPGGVRDPSLFATRGGLAAPGVVECGDPAAATARLRQGASGAGGGGGGEVGRSSGRRRRGASGCREIRRFGPNFVARAPKQRSSGIYGAFRCRKSHLGVVFVFRTLKFMAQEVAPRPQKIMKTTWKILEQSWFYVALLGLQKTRFARYIRQFSGKYVKIMV